MHTHAAEGYIAPTGRRARLACWLVRTVADALDNAVWGNMNDRRDVEDYWQKVYRQRRWRVPLAFKVHREAALEETARHGYWG